MRLLFILALLAACCSASAPGPEEATAEGVGARGGLRTTGLRAATVVRESGRWAANTSARAFTAGAVLAYVTPWNGAGADAALRFSAKLTHVSPCWYILRPGALLGRADANATWAAAMQARGVRVLPRFALELDGVAVAAALRDASALARSVADEVAAMRYDGAVLDGWAGWAAGGVPRGAAAAAFRAVAAALHARGAELALAVPPAVPAGAVQRSLFGRDDLRALTAASGPGEAVDLLSIMTYDAGVASPGSGPNAPLRWAGANVRALLAGGAVLSDDALLLSGEDAGSGERSDAERAAAARLLLGLNFYGYEFAPGAAPAPLLGRDVAALLAAHAPALRWDDDAAEHYFDYRSDGTTRRVYYPTPASIQARADVAAACAYAEPIMLTTPRGALAQRRLQLAARAGMGVSIWELGQGQNWFYDLL